MFDFRNLYLAKLLSQNYHLNLKNSALKTLGEHLQVKGDFPDPLKHSDVEHFFKWTMISQVPMLNPSSHQISSY